MRLLLYLALLTSMLVAQEDVLRVPRAARDEAPTANPESELWKAVPAVRIATGRFGEAIEGSWTEVKARWTPRYLSVLWVNHYEELTMKLGPTAAKETWSLWDFDVAEIFIGGDAQYPRRYKEFQISPAGEWVDLDVDRDRKGLEVDWRWDSGFRFKSVMQPERKVWIGEMQIPWKAIDSRPAVAGREYRGNIYRIEGKDPKRKFLAWRPVMSPSYHTPEKFGKIRLEPAAR